MERSLDLLAHIADVLADHASDEPHLDEAIEASRIRYVEAYARRPKIPSGIEEHDAPALSEAGFSLTALRALADEIRTRYVAALLVESLGVEKAEKAFREANAEARKLRLEGHATQSPARLAADKAAAKAHGQYSRLGGPRTLAMELVAVPFQRRRLGVLAKLREAEIKAQACLSAIEFDTTALSRDRPLLGRGNLTARAAVLKRVAVNKRQLGSAQGTINGLQKELEAIQAQQDEAQAKALAAATKAGRSKTGRAKVVEALGAAQVKAGGLRLAELGPDCRPREADYLGSAFKAAGSGDAPRESPSAPGPRSNPAASGRDAAISNNQHGVVRQTSNRSKQRKRGA